MSPLTKDPDALRCIINLISAVFSFLSLFSFLGGRSAGSFPEQCSVIEPRSVIGQSLGMREGINFDLLRAL